MSAETRATGPHAAPALTVSAQVDADHAERAARDPQRIVTTLLRSKSVEGRRILAILAGGPGTTPTQLEDAGRAMDRASASWDAGGQSTAGVAMELAQHLTDPHAGYVADYARVCALQLSTPDDVSAGIGLMEIAHHLSGGQGPGGRERDLWAQLLLVRGGAGDPERARRVLDLGGQTPETAAYSRIDLANPFRPVRRAPDDHPETGTWWAALEKRLGAGRGSTIRLGGVDDLFAPGFLHRFGLDPAEVVVTPFDRLVGTPGAVVEHFFRVTVIMSTFNPGPAALLAARSLVSQTWENWELLVVDDASPAPTPGVLEAIEALDPRIHVIRKAVNGGTYRCRNTAIRRATGDAIVVLDSDDWAHPELLEAGVRPLLDALDPLHTGGGTPQIATRQLALRIGDDLRITRPGYPGAISCAPSLMVPMVPGVATIGFFDPVRKAADTEYARRLEAATGRRVHQSRDVLVLMRTDAESLSAADFSRGWRHSSRHEYKNAYAGWHRRIAAGADPWLDPDGPPQIAGPARWSSAPRVPGAPRPHVDVVMAGDWRRYGGPQRSMLEEIRALLEDGRTVGVMHLEAMRFMVSGDDPLCAPVQKLLDEGRVRLVHLDDQVDVDVVMLRYPPILQYPPFVARRPDGSTPVVRPRHLLLVANQAPAEADGSDQRYVVADVTRHARELFGADPVWVPQGPSIRRILEVECGPGELADWDDPGLIDGAAWQVRSPDDPVGEVPVVGRYSRDDRIKFPTRWETMVAAHDFGPGVEVRMMGARSTVHRLQQAALDAGEPVLQPSSPWEILPHGSMDVLDLLGGLDVFVYVDNPDAHEAFGRSLLEAAASGVPVVTIPKHRDTFGDLLLYAEPHDVPAVVDRLLTDPEFYAARVAHQIQAVAERYSHASFAQKLSAYLRGDGNLPDPREPGAEVDSPPTDCLRTGWERAERATPTTVTVHTTGDPREPLTVEVHTTGPEVGQVALTMPLRRPADAERADALAAVGSGTAVRATLTAFADATAAGEGEREALEAAHRALLQHAGRALVLLRDGEAAAIVPPGTRIDPPRQGATGAGAVHRPVRLHLPTGPATGGLAWRLSDPEPARVTLAVPQEMTS